MLKQIQAHLLGLANQTIEPDELKLGICAELEYLTEKFFLLVIIFDPTGWEHYSGNRSYPVPITAGDNRAPGEFYYHYTKWDDSEYADLRRDLCRYLATTEGVITYESTIRL